MANRIKVTYKNVSVEHVKKLYDVVEATAGRGDDEAAASFEYSMWQHVLSAVAAKNPNADKLARVALKTAKLEFRRG